MTSPVKGTSLFFKYFNDDRSTKSYSSVMSEQPMKKRHIKMDDKFLFFMNIFIF